MIALRSDVSIRLYDETDQKLLIALLGDPQMMRFLGGPESEEALAARHVRYLAADPTTNGLFTIITGRECISVGWVGFWELEWEGEKAWECGWHVLIPFQNVGVASTATMLALDAARQRCRHRWMHAFPSIDNTASNALCRRLGFVKLGEVDVEYPKGKEHLMRVPHWRFNLEAPR